MRPASTLLLAILLGVGGLGPSRAATHATQKVTAGSVHLQAAMTKALTQYQRDLVSILALRASARPLLGAALLARPLDGQPPGLHFGDLIKRAAAADDAGDDALWMQLSDCDHKAGTCPNPQALDALEKQVPDNAAVWIMAYTKAQQDGDTDAAKHAMHMAAAAKRYDDYAGDSLQALAYAVRALPVPKSLRAADRPAAVTRQIIAFGIGDAQPTPVFPAIAQHCSKDTDDASVHAQCLQLASILVWGGNPLARSLGLHLQATLSPSKATRAKAADAHRDLIWQVTRFSKLKARAAREAAVASRMLQLARAGGTQMSIMLASLRAFHIDVDAPEGWKPDDASTQG